MLQRLLLHPRATLTIVIVSCAAIDTACAGIVTSIAPLEHVHGLDELAPRISAACTWLGVVSNVALALAGIGRSFISAIDNAKNSVDNDGLAPGAAQAPTVPPGKEVAK